MSTVPCRARGNRPLHLPGVESGPKPGVYKDLIDAARARNAEYPKIWDLFAFQPAVTDSLSRFSQGVLRTSATISPALRELIAAWTSLQNECGFCTRAHAAAAAELLGSEDLVRAAGWDDEAIYFSVTTCALFNFYNRWITASGVAEMPEEAHRVQGQRIARQGYIREEHE
jgi:AhpD family alkylhydroperoxidase